MKVVINSCYGGFSLSSQAYTLLKEVKGNPEKVEYSRHDNDLVKIIETLGEKANGSCAALQIVEIEDDVAYEIREYDGYEGVYLLSQMWKVTRHDGLIAIVLAESKTEVREKVSVLPLFKANIKSIEPIKEGFYITES